MCVRSGRCLAGLLTVFLLSAVPSVDALAQAGALSGLLGNATDFNFFWAQSGAPRGELIPERGAGAAGVGFELSFAIPGAWTRRRRPAPTPDLSAKGTSCDARFRRRELVTTEECSDTTWNSLQRDSARTGISYKQEQSIKQFRLSEDVFTFELAVGFSQTGAFVSRRSENDVRVSLREAPSVSVYATYEPGLFSLSTVNFTGYFGGRSGLISLNAGRAFTDSSITKFSGETFQIGPVVGLVAKVNGINLFAEGAYLWRDFKSVEWERDTGLGTLPRRIDLSGYALALGAQFELADPRNR